ncbi:uncharacterized protein BP01DRAFT_388697 [Aspergillus saccharolyticus JOP 1030-1]|uniref:Uncharacterized protein n=1 Tax=Aspergillus saccharolyticus JOP 1030-1 TaxID=1450539 RepID=A0A318ZML5_9EURO|nr:hypothetical protein BP01DRAFT_388697 [Aspergillus saccharolyticus JOP 1030-1]PYH48861.1 hypothetical protein BP01DRAFT_388697 [Aspergillus saccharolyticus JOP 1030-1]
MEQNHPPSSSSSSTSSIPLFPATCLILSFIFCLYRLRASIATCYRHFRRQHNHYTPLAPEDRTPPPPTSSLSSVLSSPAALSFAQEAVAIPATPLSKYFDPQTNLLYDYVLERRVSPSLPVWEDEVKMKQGWEGDEEAAGEEEEGGLGQAGDSDGTGTGIDHPPEIGMKWFDGLVERVVRYYEGLVWG